MRAVMILITLIIIMVVPPAAMASEASSIRNDIHDSCHISICSHGSAFEADSTKQ